MFGGNDDHDFMTGLPEGVTIATFDSASWVAEYRRRVGGLMDTITRDGAFLVWIGLPITHDPAQTRRFDTINAIVQSEAAKRPGRVTYLDTYFIFAGTTAAIAQYRHDGLGEAREDARRRRRPLRARGRGPDRREVLQRLNQRFDLTSWRNGNTG